MPVILSGMESKDPFLLSTLVLSEAFKRRTDPSTPLRSAQDDIAGVGSLVKVFLNRRDTTIINFQFSILNSKDRAFVSASMPPAVIASVTTGLVIRPCSRQSRIWAAS